MKTLKHYFAALLLFAISFGALAGPNVKDVENAMRAKNWSGAEQMLNQVLAKKPNSAKAHYLLAQTHEQMGQRSLAAQDLERAKAADPSLKFASPNAVGKMEARLNGQTTRYAEQPAKRLPQATQAQTSTHVPFYDKPAPVTTQATQNHTAPIVVQDQSKSSGGGGFLIFLLALVVIGGGGFFLYTTRQKKQALAAAAAKADAERRALLARAVDLQTRTTELQKTLRYESQEDSQLGLLVGNLVSNATSALSRLKGSTSDTFNYRTEDSKLNNLEDQIHSAEGRLAAKDFDGAKEAAAQKKRQEEVAAAERRTAQLRAEREREEATRRAAQAVRDAEERERRARLQAEEDRRDREYQAQHGYSRNSGGYNGGSRTVEHHHHHNNGGGAGDLLTGVLIGQAISSASHAHGHSNRSNNDGGWGNDNNTPAYEAPAPRYEEPEAPALDFGGSGGGDDGFDNTRDEDEDRNKNDDDGF
jgi:hypothetical protein